MTTLTPNVGMTQEWDSITPSTAYKFFYPGIQATGDLTDQSGQNNNAAAETNLTDGNMWANAGYVSATNGTLTGVAVPIGVVDWDLNNASPESFILSFLINMAAVEDGIVGNTSSGTKAGIQFAASLTSNKITCFVRDGASSAGIQGVIDILDSTDHVYGIAIDGVTGIAYTYGDGLFIGSTDVRATIPTASTESTTDTFVFGSDSNATADKTYASKYNGIHCLQISGGLPGNIADIMKKLASSPLYPLSVDDVGV